MSRPYYADERVTLWHGDCRDVDLPHVDAVLTDPPYARSELVLWRVLALLAAKRLRPGGWLAAYSGQACLPEVYAALTDPELVYRWTLSARYEGGGQIVSVGELAVLSEWKPILAYRRRGFDSPRGAGGRFVAGDKDSIRDLLRRGGRGKLHHPWEQPLGEASQLVESFSRPGELILDPFAGSGSFLVAAKSAGRSAVGVEVDEAHCETAALRLSQGVLDFDASPSVVDVRVSP